MSKEFQEDTTWLLPFRDEAILTDVLGPIRSGKEAVIYLCRAHPSLEREFAVAKVYRDRRSRGFTNDARYQEGQKIHRMEGAGRIKRAMGRNSDLGEVVRAALWAEHEYEVLEALFDHGWPVPEPLAVHETTVVMALTGEDGVPAPQLREAPLDEDAARAACETLLAAVRGWLALNVVHADLSEYNVLHDGSGPVVIDFPQAVDPRFNSHARALLERDLRSLARFFGRFGIEVDAEAEAAEAWSAFERGIA